MNEYLVKMSFIIFGLAGLLLFLPASPSSAQSGQPDGATLTSISGSLGFATDCCDAGEMLGLGFGAAVYHTNDIEIRADLSYFTGEDGPFEITRIPLIVSGRFYVPQGNKDIDFYVQGGLGLSFDKAEFDGCRPFGCFSDSESDTNIDLVPAAGILFKVSPSFHIGGEAAIHITDETYLALMLRGRVPLGK